MSKKVDYWKSLNALLGVYGVKTSLLMQNDQYWECAMALWPTIRRPYGATLEDLQKQIKLLPKSKRRQQAISNIHELPIELLSAAPKHQHRLSAALYMEMHK